MKQSLINPLEALEQLKRKAHWLKSYRGTIEAGTLNSADRVDVAAAIAADIAGLSDVDACKKSAELMTRAGQGDPAALRTLNALRIEKYNNWVLADANRASFFCEQVTLADGDTAAFVNQTKNQVLISAISVDGGLKRFDPIQTQGFETIPLKLLTTPEITSVRKDIYQGRDVSAQVEETLELQADMTGQVEAEVDYFLDTAAASGGAFGDFVLTGAKYGRIYAAHSRVKTANFPTTNKIKVAGTGKTTKFRTAVLKAIIDYASAFGNVFQGQRLAPTGRILIASGAATGIMDEGDISAPTGTIAANLVANDWISFHFGGRDWVIVPDNTLDPDAGLCYPEFNLKPIRLLTKPSMDEDRTSDLNTYEAAKSNLKKRFMQKVVGAYLNSSMRHAMAQFQYKLPA